MAKVKSTGVTMQCPVKLGTKRDGRNLWMLPIEPLVSVRASKTIVRRNIAKAAGAGTVKEQWSQDDYEITIDGLFQSTKDGAYPEADVSKLQALLVKGQSLVIRCKVLDTLGINQICISSWNLPNTPGVENQQYSITAYSDQDFDLII